VKLTPAERAEIAHLFRLKLALLREQPPRHAPRRPRRRLPKVTLPVEQPANDTLLRPGELAALLRVSPKTLATWSLPCLYTLGGQRRYRWRDVRVHLERAARL
jgi:hypothetical protein